MSRNAYEATTHAILVRVTPAWLEDQSDPARGRHVWSYTIDIENRGKTTVQLLARHWIITDALNRVEEVEGPGVVGEQPILAPGEAFRYTSGCPLPTSSGAMRGTYRMRREDGALFDIAIPEFSLHLPDATRRMN
jgi:ApaG protein